MVYTVTKMMQFTDRHRKRCLVLLCLFFFFKPVQLILFPDRDFESSLTLSRGQPGKNKRTIDILLNRSSTYKYWESWTIRVFGYPRGYKVVEKKLIT